MGHRQDERPDNEELEREETPKPEKEAYTTARFEPILTPPDTLSAPLLAGAIQPSTDPPKPTGPFQAEYLRLHLS